MTVNQSCIIPSGQRFEMPFDVPYYSQFSSPELVLPIIRGDIKAEDDPRWSEFGAETKETYAHWSRKACGIASLKMAIEALGGPKLRMMEWIEEALSINGFLPRDKVAPGKPSGWIHAALVKLACLHGLDGELLAPASLEQIAENIAQSKVVIASVSHELGERFKISINSGHLVLVHGYSVVGKNIEALLINNPSGRYEELRQNCWIPARRFASGFSGRVIALFRRD